jgi:hypothetical protein
MEPVVHSSSTQSIMGNANAQQQQQQQQQQFGTDSCTSGIENVKEDILTMVSAEDEYRIKSAEHEHSSINKNIHQDKGGGQPTAPPEPPERQAQQQQHASASEESSSLLSSSSSPTGTSSRHHHHFAHPFKKPKKFLKKIHMYLALEQQPLEHMLIRPLRQKFAEEYY